MLDLTLDSALYDIPRGTNLLVETSLPFLFSQGNENDSMPLRSLKDRFNFRNGTPSTSAPGSSLGESLAGGESQFSSGPGSVTSGDATSHSLPVTRIDDSLRYRAVGPCFPQKISWPG